MSVWISQINSFYTHGTLPEIIVKAKTPAVFVYVLDLGVVVPLSVFSAWRRWCEKHCGYVFSGLVLVKAAMMGLVLLSMMAFAIGADLEVNATETLARVVRAGAGPVMSVWHFGHRRDSV